MKLSFSSSIRVLDFTEHFFTNFIRPKQPYEQCYSHTLLEVRRTHLSVPFLAVFFFSSFLDFLVFFAFSMRKTTTTASSSLSSTCYSTTCTTPGKAR